MARTELSLSEMYGSQDLGASPLFAGDYINFGLWTESDAMTQEGRANASSRLYDAVVDRLGLKEGDSVLEVGCGRGVGLSRLVSRQKLGRVFGVDASPEQIDRAKARHSGSAGSVEFLFGRAEVLPLQNGSVTAVYSVEAAQHFIDMQSFIDEMKRVLVPGGRFALTTFFLRPGADMADLAALIPTVHDKIDRPYSIAQVEAWLRPSFEVEVSGIGNGVWPYFDRWIGLSDPNDWGRNWKVAWERGLIEYYIISGKLK